MAQKKINKKEEIKKIPIKNYIIVIIIFIISISLALFLRNWYKSYQDYQNTIPVLEGIISEVRYNEIDNYIMDNQSAIIYIGVADDNDCRELETELKRVIDERHLKDKVVYFNISDIEDRDLLLNEFNDKYAVYSEVSTYPAIVLIENGKIIDLRSKTASKNLLISDVEQLLDLYGVKGD